MKFFNNIALVATIMAVAPALQAAPEGWIEDLDIAIQQAQEQKKDILIDFTGSDWCGWCVKLDKEVFSTPFFREKAKEKYILVYADFPQNKQMSSEQRAKNDKLAKQFGIRGYPSIVLLDSNGKKYAQTGYRAGGPEAYIEHLVNFEGLKKIRAEFVKKIEEANKLTGKEKAIALDKALGTIPADEIRQEQEIVNQILAADPKNETGVLDSYYPQLVIGPCMTKAIENVRERLKGEIEQLENDSRKLMSEKKKPQEDPKIIKQYEKINQECFNEIITQLTKLNDQYQFKGVSKQAYLFNIGFYTYRLSADEENKVKAIKILEEALKAAPESQYAPRIKQMLNNLK